MSVLAIVPARSGSKGIPGKNWKHLPTGPAGCSKALFLLACDCAWAAGVDRVVVSSDRHFGPEGWQDRFVPIAGMTAEQFREHAQWLNRPPELAQDDTPMIAVVQHALQQIPGQSDDIIVLLQPTQPLRKPEHVTAAIQLLQERSADSVVSVVQLPLSHSPDLVCEVDDGRLYPWTWVEFAHTPTRRQDAEPAYIRDGTVYAFRRATVDRYGDIYGQHVCALFINPEDSCELDTMADWAEVERRWQERHAR